MSLQKLCMELGMAFPSAQVHFADETAVNGLNCSVTRCAHMGFLALHAVSLPARQPGLCMLGRIRDGSANQAAFALDLPSGFHPLLDEAIVHIQPETQRVVESPWVLGRGGGLFEDEVSVDVGSFYKEPEQVPLPLFSGPPTLVVLSMLVKEAHSSHEGVVGEDRLWYWLLCTGA